MSVAVPLEAVREKGVKPAGKKAIVLYYTVYGNTAKAAEAVCGGLRDGGLEAECKDVRAVDVELLKAFDVIVLGSPTHAQDAPGDVKRFLRKLSRRDLEGKLGAAFDTRYVDETVGAMAVLEEAMRRLGVRILLDGLPVFLPSGAGEGPLIPNQLAKCRRFGQLIAEKASAEAGSLG